MRSILSVSMYYVTAVLSKRAMHFFIGHRQRLIILMIGLLRREVLKSVLTLFFAGESKVTT